MHVRDIRFDHPLNSVFMRLVHSLAVVTEHSNAFEQSSISVINLDQKTLTNVWLISLKSAIPKDVFVQRSAAHPKRTSLLFFLFLPNPLYVCHVLVCCAAKQSSAGACRKLSIESNFVRHPTVLDCRRSLFVNLVEIEPRKSEHARIPFVSDNECISDIQL